MKNKLCSAVTALLLLPPLAAQYQPALPGYRYEFPRDHFNHPDFQTEWWYYTGNVKAADGHRFGFELTFFRQAVSRDAVKDSSWDVRDLYLAHLALSDLDGAQFYHAERTNRPGPGMAGVNDAAGRIWNGNWQVQWHGNEQRLSAVESRFEFHLQLVSEKQTVVHGENGISQKAEGAGHASHYVSLTHLATSGTILVKGKESAVIGLSWMDHEFFTQQLDANQSGWDWLGIQLDDHTELMLFRLRRKDGSSDPYSAGTFVDSTGKTLHLRARDFRLEPAGETWTSPVTKAVYPVHWRISIPKLGIEAEQTTLLESQELTGDSRLIPNYWEGAIVVSGRRNSQTIGGTGYLEMTGYDRPVQLGLEAQSPE